MKRVVLVSLAVLLTPLLTALWAAPGSAVLPPGQWILNAGATVNFVNMDINSCNTDFAFFLIFDSNGGTVTTPNLGNNSGSTCSDTVLGPSSYTNTSGQTETVKLRLDDTSCGGLLFDSDGGGAANHATVSGKLVSINDAGVACRNRFFPSHPSKGQGSFNATLIFK